MSEQLSPEDLHLLMLRFESRTGGFNDPGKDFELDPVDAAPSEPASGHVRYERLEDGSWATTFSE